MAGHLTWEDYEAALRLARNSRAYRRNRALILQPEPLWCALCGRRIDKHLRSPHPMSKTADHRIPITDGGDPVALSNLQPAHKTCNEDRERRRRAALDGRTARPLGAAAHRVSVVDVDRWVVGEEP